LGEFKHGSAGVTQVIDREAYDRVAAGFIGRKSDSYFPVVLVDFDHFALDTSPCTRRGNKKAPLKQTFHRGF